MSPTLLVAAAWIAGVPRGPQPTEPRHEVGPLPPALRSTEPSLSRDEIFAGESVQLELAGDPGAELRVSCEALGWTALPAHVEPLSGRTHWQLTVPDDALPGAYLLEVHAQTGPGARLLAMLDLVVLADD